MVSIFLFSLMNLEKQPAPLTTFARMCIALLPMSKQVMSQRCVAMVSCYSAVASMRKLRITRGSGALERQHQQHFHPDLDGKVEGGRVILKQVKTGIHPRKLKRLMSMKDVKKDAEQLIS